MSVSIRIPTPLRPHVAGARQVAVEAVDVRAALAALTAQHAGIAPHLFAENGELRAFVNL